jgi:hypothetical protein
MSPIQLDPIVSDNPDCDVPDGGTGTPVTLNEGGDPIDVVQAGPGIQLGGFTTEVVTCTPPIDDTPSMPSLPPPPSALISLGNRVYQFHSWTRVSEQGSQYLYSGDVNTAAVALIIEQNFAFRGASISVDVADPTNTYELELLLSTGVGYSVAERLVLPSTTLGAVANDLTVEGDLGNGIGFRLIRTDGSGKSAFHLVTVSVALRDR